MRKLFVVIGESIEEGSSILLGLFLIFSVVLISSVFCSKYASVLLYVIIPLIKIPICIVLKKILFDEEENRVQRTSIRRILICVGNVLKSAFLTIVYIIFTMDFIKDDIQILDTGIAILVALVINIITATIKSVRYLR